MSVAGLSGSLNAMCNSPESLHIASKIPKFYAPAYCIGKLKSAFAAVCAFTVTWIVCSPSFSCTAPSV